MRLKIDFAESSRTGQLPRHGWAKNSQGFKLLWLPILRLSYESQAIRRVNGFSDDVTREQHYESLAFRQAVERFALSLRELAKLVRDGRDPCFDCDDLDRANTSLEARSMIPIFVDLGFVYARRLADHFTRAIRYALFKHTSSAPKKFKQLLATQNFEHLCPICDVEILREALMHHAGWFELLRNANNNAGILCSPRGLRDIMEHKPVAVNVSHFSLDNGPWEIEANLFQYGDMPEFRVDLIQTLRDVVYGMCLFWDIVCDAAALTPCEKLWVAPYGDNLPLTGDDADSTAFWPESLAVERF